MPRPLGRYLLWQVPGWLAVGALAAAAAQLLDLPAWVAPVAVALAVAKDLLLFPAMRAVFRPAASPRLVGARGIAVTPLAPDGQVRVRGELWRARTRSGAHVPAGRRVRVVVAEGLTLLVDVED